jgi:AcrR family transcriptional regulator
MPKVSQQYRDARRDRILDAAKRCFLRDGFHATSMQDLFAEAGLSSGAVYRYFASKDDVIIAIAEDNMRAVVATIHAVAARDPGASVGAALAEVLEIAQAGDARDGLGQIAVLVWGEALRSPSIAARFRDMLTQMRAGLAELVGARQDSAGLPASVPADTLAAALLSIVPGYILQLVMLGPAAVDGIPDAVRALWPPQGPSPAQAGSQR